MKKTILILAAILCCAATASADEFVNGYTRRDGTYVAPHYRTAPDNSTYNNYSTQGNTNPYTGERGSEPLFDTRPTRINPYGRSYR